MTRKGKGCGDGKRCDIDFSRSLPSNQQRWTAHLGSCELKLVVHWYLSLVVHIRAWTVGSEIILVSIWAGDNLALYFVCPKLVQCSVACMLVQFSMTIPIQSYIHVLISMFLCAYIYIRLHEYNNNQQFKELQGIIKRTTDFSSEWSKATPNAAKYGSICC